MAQSFALKLLSSVHTLYPIYLVLYCRLSPLLLPLLDSAAAHDLIGRLLVQPAISGQRLLPDAVQVKAAASRRRKMDRAQRAQGKAIKVELWSISVGALARQLLG